MFDHTMPSLHTSFNVFQNALQSGAVVDIDGERWIKLGWLSRLINWVLRRDDARISRIINVFQRFLNEIETGVSVLNALECRAAAEQVCQRARVFQSEAVRKLEGGLSARLLSLQFRQGQKNAVPFDQENHQRIVAAATAWQRNDPLFSHEPLTEVEIDKLKDISCYSDFAALILRNRSERDFFFRWTIRHRNNVLPYVFFRNTVSLLTDAELSTRIGYHGGKDLSIRNHQLTLLMEGRPYPIQNPEARVTFSHNLTLSNREVFAVFRNREYVVGNLEYFSQLGICNYNPKKMGSLIAPNQYRSIYLVGQWWKQLVPDAVLTPQEASRRFVDIQGLPLRCDGRGWIFSIFCASDSLAIDAIGNHAYVQVAIPNDEGNYELYSFGKFTDTFPRTLREKMEVGAQAKPAIIMSPDENIYRLDRLQMGISWLLTPEQGHSRLNSIRKDIQNAALNNLYFQLFNDNCIMWAFKKVRHLISEEEKRALCGIRFVEATPRAPFGYFWTFLRAFPEFTHKPFLDWAMKKFGADRIQHVVKKNGTLGECCLLRRTPWTPSERMPHPGAFVINRLQLKRQNGV